jgi:hypothetical protein
MAADTTTRRTLTDVLYDLVEAREKMEACEAEIEQLTGMPCDRFILGARALVLPEPDGGRALQELRERFGGAL